MQPDLFTISSNVILSNGVNSFGEYVVTYIEKIPFEPSCIFENVRGNEQKSFLYANTRLGITSFPVSDSIEILPLI